MFYWIFYLLLVVTTEIHSFGDGGIGININPFRYFCERFKRLPDSTCAILFNEKNCQHWENDTFTAMVDLLCLTLKEDYFHCLTNGRMMLNLSLSKKDVLYKYLLKISAFLETVELLMLPKIVARIFVASDIAIAPTYCERTSYFSFFLCYIEYFNN